MENEEIPTVVAGATGRIGGETARALTAAGVAFRALVRAPERRADLPDPRQDVIVADLDDEAGLRDALRGARRLLLCSAHGPRMGAQQRGVVRAAEAAGVRRVVKISASPASIFPGTPAAAAAAHLEVEDALRASSMEAVMIRPNAFAQVILGFRPQIDTGVVRLPLGDAAVSWVDAADVGRVAARVLMDDATEGILEVTGPAGLTMSEVCDAIGTVVGRPVAYEAVSDEQALAGLAARGVDPWYAEHVIGVFSLFRERDAGRTTDTVERLTGRAPTPVRDVLRRHRAMLGVDG